MLEAEIDRLANLAEITMDREERATLAEDLERIVGYVSALEAAPSRIAESGEDPPIRLGLSGLRADVIAPSLSYEDLQRFAPNLDVEGFRVPSFVDKGK